MAELFIKHFLHEGDREELTILLEQYGAEAYGIYWLILEQIGKALQLTAEPEKKLSGETWVMLCKTTPELFSKVLTFLKSKGIFSSHEDAETGRLITIRCNRMLHICGSPQMWKAKKAALGQDEENLLSDQQKNDSERNLLGVLYSRYPVKHKGALEEALPVWQEFDVSYELAEQLMRVIFHKNNSAEWLSFGGTFIPPFAFFLREQAESGLYPMKKDRVVNAKFSPVVSARARKLFDEEIFAIYPEHRRVKHGEALSAWFEVLPDKEDEWPDFTKKVKAGLVAAIHSEKWAEENGKWIPGIPKFLRQKQYEPKNNPGCKHAADSKSGGGKNQGLAEAVRQKRAERGY